MYEADPGKEAWLSPRTPSTEDLEILLRRQDPARSLRAERVETALDELGAAIAARPRPVPIRKRRIVKRRVLILVAAVVLALGATVAVASVLTAHTGRYPTPADEAMGGPGELLNPTAPDFRGVLRQISADIPYPPGYEYWRDFFISDEVRTDAGETDTLVSTGAIHGWLAASAYCAWIQSWRQADLRRDTAAAARAKAVIAAAPGWKAVTDEDPHPDASVPGDDGSIQYSLFGWMLPYRAAVLDGDRGAVEHLLATAYGSKCGVSDPDWRAELASHREWDTLSPSARAQKYMEFLASERS
jgi:hypothetical protein